MFARDAKTDKMSRDLQYVIENDQGISPSDFLNSLYVFF